MEGLAAKPAWWPPRWLAVAGGTYALTVGALTLVGYATGERRLTDWNNEGISMFPNTAACAVCSGLSLLLLARDEDRKLWRIVVRVLGGIVAAFGGLTLLQHVTGANFGIDTLLSDRPWGQRAATAPLRMGPPASSSYLVIGVALILATSGARRRGMASALAIVVLGIATLSLVGYWFHADQLFGVARFTGIAFQTSTVLAAIGIALAAAVPERGLARILRRDDAGGVICRRLLLPIIALPLALGWARVAGQNAGYFDTAFGTAVLALAMIGMLVALLWWTASGLSREAQLARAAEQGVRDSEARLRAIFDTAIDGIITINEVGLIESANPAAERMFGYSRAELVGANVSLLMPNPYRREHGSYLANYLRTGQRKVIGIGREVVGLRKDGTQFPMELSVSELSLGGRRMFTGLVRDISERQRAEESLRRERERLVLALSAGQMGAYDWDIAQSTLWWSPELYQLFGVSEGQFQPSTGALTGLLHPDDRQGFWRQLNHSIEAGELFIHEYRIVLPGGQVRWIASRAQTEHDASGRPVRHFGVAQDISERKRIEMDQELLRTQLAAKVQELQTVFDIAPVQIWIGDGYGQTVIGNRAAYEQYGLKPGTNPSFDAPVPDIPAGWRAIANGRDLAPAEMPMQLAASTRRAVLGFEHEVLHPDGKRISVWANVAPMLDDSGNVRGVVGIYLDVTSLKQAQEALREADRRKDQFLATLAHELRNPLAAMGNSLELMKRCADDEQVIGDCRQTIERQMSQLVRLVDDLLDISRITRDRLELRRQPVELASIVHHAAEACRPLVMRFGHGVHLSLPPQPVWLDADPARLTQVFENLLNNACKYTEPGGRISLHAELDGNEQVVVRVCDTGVGIAPEMLPRVFDVFVQVDQTLSRSQGGLGIGLSLVKRLVEMHGGAVEARSQGRGRGSEFIVRLPVVAAPAEEELHTAPTQAAATVATNGQRVLVVDDNRDSARTLALLLTRIGYQTQIAYDGIEAVERASEYDPDIVLLDIGLPGLNGYDVCRAIRAATAAGLRPIMVAISGYGTDADRCQSVEAGFDGHLVKPIDLSQLTELLDAHSDRRSKSSSRASVSSSVKT